MATEKDAKGLMTEGVPVDPKPQQEADLIDQLIRCDEDPGKIAFKPGQLCERTERQRAAVPHLERAADTALDPEVRADLRLRCGRLMEQVGDFEAASAHYEHGLTETITATDVRYFLHNNLGFCLNELARHAEAVTHCRGTLDIERKRHNAYKNLALALEHLNDLGGAASHFAAVAQLAPNDRQKTGPK
jgi:tetratricopeptide (TPR) repeat protein